jgi:stress-induced morphogen
LADPAAVEELLADVKRLIEDALPGGEATVTDEHGGDHLLAVVSAPQFEGLSRIEQHRLVRNAVQSRMDDGSVHALSIRTSPSVQSGA